MPSWRVCGLSDDEMGRVYLAAEEAVINSIKYAIYDVSDKNSIRSSSGRGLFLMKAMTDEAVVISTPGEGTSVYLSIHLGKNK